MRIRALAVVALALVSCGGIGGRLRSDAGVELSYGPCRSANECPADESCFVEFPNGLCARACVDDSTCAGDSCQASAFGHACLHRCVTDADCRLDLRCALRNGAKVCSAPAGDAGVEPDAGSTTDAGSMRDAGSTPDAGVGRDAGSNSVDAGVTCNPASPQPDVCGYGGVCRSNGACGLIDDGTCSNVTAAIGRGYHQVWSASSSGPVIYNVFQGLPDQSDCSGSSAAFTVTVYAYSTTAFPASKSDLQGFFYFNDTGDRADIPLLLLKPSNYTPIGKTMSARFTLCADTGSKSLAAAFAFTNGNASCAALTR